MITLQVMNFKYSFYRWLIANKRTERVEKIYKRMAKINGYEMSESKMSVWKKLTGVSETQVRRTFHFKIGFSSLF